MNGEVVSLLGEVGLGSLGAFWIPMAVWSLAVAAYLVLDLAGFRSVPMVRLAAGRALFFALPGGLMLGAARGLLSVASLPATMEPRGVFSGFPLPLLVVVPEPAWVLGVDSGVWILLGAATVLAIGAAVPAMVRLIGSHAAAVRRLASLPEVRDRRLLRILEQTKERLGIRSQVRLFAGAGEPAPLVYGIRRPAIVVPDDLFGQEERLRMVLGHELAHVRSRDTLYGAAERLFAALFACNPLVGVLARRIQALREVRCDAVVLRLDGVPIRAYAELLWEYAEVGGQAGSIGSLATMAGSSSQLKQRILEMKHASSAFSARQARFSALLGGMLFVAVAFLVGCTDTGQADREGDVPATAPEETVGKVFTEVDQMPDIEGGIIPALSGVIRYPETARAAGAEGRVVVEFVVDEQGMVESAEVVQAVREDLDAEAVRAVKTLTFKPGRHEGQAVRVKLIVPVQFRLR